MRILWTELAWNDYCSFFDKHDIKTINSIHKLLKDIRRNGIAVGIGQPEMLRHELSGYWSRRIDKENRLVYELTDDVLTIVQCGTHYHKES